MSLYLGLPQWSHPSWPGQLLGLGAKPAEHLAHYATVFNSVEGNTTFYALPTPDTVQRWADAVPDHFRFNFKFPQTISHQSDLVSADKQVADFIRLLAPLHDKLGLLTLQLPARFGPQGLARLAAFIDRLPRAFRYALEVRHPEFFAKGEAERALNRLLMEQGVNRVMLDSRPLFSVQATTPALVDAQGKKPRLPVHLLATANAPMVRFIGLPDPAANHPFLPSWLPHWRQWLAEGKELYLYIHTADNAQAPELARQITRLLEQEMAPWPGENDRARQGVLRF
ncbi:DUF72 domain-containing protein [Aeromonas veronii]|uniref:DUF72 domain-containing protein n=1 Tax=Aeromonas veronii TaxID=654 RepID=UPI0007186042|nr:DUF72 domain-containing protein [Aeromonas veronii]KRV84241.1 hypothetical protein AO718_18615 [Aeromonas veronii]KRW04189.1 hypothetical protein AO725_10275 [Aeromonas veronii]KRW12636.1 hypothetical protein AO745_12600 [Aeromonas veronii]KRW14507.1 hypothetical protein AO732_15980 [Aeromonas veronii]KRW22228.1 hypothetical protein AO734_14570 [Aeromonas veronii]